MLAKAAEAGRDRIRKAVQEYIDRVKKLTRSRQGCSTDMQIDCPSCGRYRGMQWYAGEWRCFSLGCRYAFPPDFVPPSPEALQQIFVAAETQKTIERMRALGIRF